MENVDDLIKQEANLNSELNNSLQLAAYEERRLVDATGYDKKVSKKMRDSYYEEATETREKLLEVRRKINILDN